MNPVSIRDAEHYLWGSACDGWHLVRSASLAVIEERMPPGTSEERHFHRESRQFFYVLAGTLSIEADGVPHSLPAKSGLEIPPGVAHQVSNTGAADVRFLVVSQPPSHGDRVAAPI